MHTWHCVTDYTHIISQEPGCYAIYRFNLDTQKKQIIYIGTAKNLDKRLSKHPVVRVLRALIDFPDVVMIKCKTYLNKTQRILMEDKLINRIKPKANY
jgi:excinuclease UvrABC nuclease subunit